MVHINIDGREMTGRAGQTLLEIARENGVEIPTLCHDERVKTYGACGICLVEVEGTPKLFRACSTAAANGMVVTTNSPKIAAARKTALELLLSDHDGDCRPPCALACPAQTDCQGYVGLIANGQYRQALEVIKDRIPLPASIGRVCPHPCETACRREMVEEPISIAYLKSYAADIDLNSGNCYIPEMAENTGKKVAVIGGGPGGLSAAYYLKILGHNVTVYEQMPHMGGMLRYGIPEYRLPKNVLSAEIKIMEEMGIELKNNVKIGKDVTLDYLKEQFDALIIAVGAWSSSKLRCPGEDLQGVIGGIDFLRKVACGEVPAAGRRVAVVGGGNTAMDACRTAVRLGAESVCNIYRRSRAEMPAEEIEIVEAEEEGVIFKNLTNPIEIIEKDGRAAAVRLQKMELGEPDASGRRSPVPIAGAEETIDVDIIIIAIGQGLNPEGLNGVELTKKGTISADEKTFLTNIEGVFAIGDATNKGASIAIEAIGEAKSAAEAVDTYLKGELSGKRVPYLVTREMTEDDFGDRQKISRAKMPHLSPDARKNNFRQVNLGFTEEAAKKEANRCLECGCLDYFECKLIAYGNEYNVKPEQYKSSSRRRKTEEVHPFIERNVDKCILCGLCARVCDEVMGRAAIGLASRGFDTLVTPEMYMPLKDSSCISCGQCVTLCPTGALVEKMPSSKPVPHNMSVGETVSAALCSYCSVGCGTKIHAKGHVVTRALPDSDVDKTALLCAKGRFGLGEAQLEPQLVKPLVKRDGALTETDWREAYMHITKKAQSIAMKYGSGALAVAVSDTYTNEEISAISGYAKNALKAGRLFSFSSVKSGLKAVLGHDTPSNDFEELHHTEVILLICDDITASHTIAGINVKKAAEQGAKVIVVSAVESQADEWATMKVNRTDTVLAEFVKAAINIKGETENNKQLADFVKETTVSEDVQKAAELYVNAKKAMIVFEQNALTTDGQILVADLAVVSGHIGKPRTGLIALKPNCNSRGLADSGIETDYEGKIKELGQTIKGLLIFGEDIPDADLSKPEFVMVQDRYMTETAKKADVVLPAAVFAETGGTYTNTVGVTQTRGAALPPLCQKTNVEIIEELSGLIEQKGEAAEQEANTVVKCGTQCCTTCRAAVKAPEGKEYFRKPVNTSAMFNRFMAFMDKEGIKKS